MGGCRDGGGWGILGDAPTPFPFEEAREEVPFINLTGSCESCDHADSLRSKLISFEEGVLWAAGVGDSSLSVSGKAA